MIYWSINDLRTGLSLQFVLKQEGLRQLLYTGGIALPSLQTAVLSNV